MTRAGPWSPALRDEASDDLILKPVQYTPVIGTTFLVFSLDSVRSRFQIMQIFPGYRNHFSQGGIEPLESERCSPFRPRLLAPHHQP
jgi:hypothetical protein